MSNTQKITIAGRDFSLTKDERTGYWRVRRRVKHDVNIDRSTHIRDLAEARKWCKDHLGNRLGETRRLLSGDHTLEEVVVAYLSFPKNVREYVAEANVARLRTIVREVYHKELSEVQARHINYTLWERYALIRQGGDRLDFSTPKRINITIMSAIRCAGSVFTRSLQHRYQELGMRLDFDSLHRYPVLPEAKIHRKAIPQEAQTKLMVAWRALKQTDSKLYTAIGLALWAGLRAGEIAAAKRHWLEQEGVQLRVVLRDREEENFRTKGKVNATWMSGLVIDMEFAAHLLSLPEGHLVPLQGRNKDYYFDSYCNTWVRQFITKEMSQKGMHALRALYAQAVKERFGMQIMAHAASLEAARSALGHQSLATTINHYLPS
jgi:integrase